MVEEIALSANSSRYTRTSSQQLLHLATQEDSKGEGTSTNSTHFSISAAERQPLNRSLFTFSSHRWSRYQRGVPPLSIIVSIELQTSEKSSPQNRRPSWARRGRSVLSCPASPSYISSCRRLRRCILDLRRYAFHDHSLFAVVVRNRARGICVRSKRRKRRATLPTPASHADVRSLRESSPARTSGSRSLSWQPRPTEAGPYPLPLPQCHRRAQTDGPH